MRLGSEPDEAVLDMLAPEEHQELLRLLQRDDRLRYAATRAALRQILAREYGLPPTLKIVRNTFGKPLLAETAGLEFNVSHAGAWGLIAVSRDGQVGVDVEKMVPLSLVGLVELVCTPLEQASLARLPLPAQRAEFFRLWVGKEAALKLVGVGIAGEHMPLLALQDDGSAQAHAPLPFDVDLIQLEALPIGNGYCAAVALSSARH